MQKIVTLTLNPALDVATRVSSVAPEIKLRCAAPAIHPGGGGINVARAIHYLGGQALAVHAAGGHNGALIRQLLDAEAIDNLPVPIRDQTRQSFAAYEESTGLQYRFSLPGPQLSQAEWRACLASAFDQDPDYLVVSGSLPPGLPDAFFSQLTRHARQRSVRVIVDSAAPSLLQTPDLGVYLLKPNLRELSLFAGEKLRDEAHIQSAARRLISEGATQALVVSMGGAGAALITRERYLHLRAPIVKPLSKVGAGDSMVAGITLRLAQGAGLDEALRYGIAAGSAAVMTSGSELCRRADADRLYQQINPE